MNPEYYEVESWSSPQEVHMFLYGKAIEIMIAIHGEKISKIPIGDLLESIEFFTKEFHNGIENSYFNFLSSNK